MYTWLDIDPVNGGTRTDRQRPGSEELPRLAYLAIEGATDAGRRILAAGTALAARLRQRRRRRTAIAQLNALDDRLLADIGLTRDAIPAVVDAMVQTAVQEPVAAEAAEASPAEREPLRLAA